MQQTQQSEPTLKRTFSARTIGPLESRMLDNHFNPSLHAKPWIAAGHLPDYKYTFDHTGLGFFMKKTNKLRTFRERHEIIEEVKQRFSTYRQFKEYNNVTNNEIVITIEYCTNCDTHQGSTRHNEEKYNYFAHELKRQLLIQLPVVKVILKPLLFDPHDQSKEAIFLRSRIGAYEVQLFSRNVKGETVQRTIFSKLTSKCWPVISKVVEEITDYLPTDDIIIHLIDNKFNMEAYRKEQEEKKGKSHPSKLRGVKVTLRPLRMNKSSSKPSNLFPELNTIRTEPGVGGGSVTARGRSSDSRPMSGQSGRSIQSARRHPTQGTIPTEEGEKFEPVREFTENSDDYGIVVFKGLPHNVYEMEIIQTQNYQGEKRV